MKRHIALALIICLLLAVFGCSNTPETQTIDVTEQAQESPFSDISIEDNGHLIISMKDGTVFDAGVVKGEKGEKGDRGSQESREKTALMVKMAEMVKMARME